MFESIFGNEPLKAYLTKAISENRLPQTLLFTGIDGIGKGLFAREVASTLLNSTKSPDLHILRPEGKSGLYAIDTLREMIDKEHAAPFEAPGKVFILEDVERMQPAAANALLKTLEEPTPDTTFILLCASHQEILPTILSRCTMLHFQPLPEEAVIQLLAAKGHPAHFAKMAQGSAGRAFELAEHPELEEQKKILFRLLAERPSYPELSLHLDKIEGLFKDEEDPIKSHRWAEHLFAYILMWHRDQHLRMIRNDPSLLFFPNEPLRESIPLERVEKAIEKGRFAFSRNMKLAYCLKVALEIGQSYYN